MIFVDRPAAVFVLVVIVGPLAATEATKVVRVIVVRKTQWLHWFTARHWSSYGMFGGCIRAAHKFLSFARCTSRALLIRA
ncbi:MAG: hypothetical protein ABR585_00825 [Gemmatimonadaceae bacterium]